MPLLKVEVLRDFRWKKKWEKILLTNEEYEWYIDKWNKKSSYVKLIK